MKFQLVVDEKGMALFTENVKLHYTTDMAGRKVYADVKNKDRGIEQLWQLVEELGMLTLDTNNNWLHCRRSLEIREVPVTD